MWLVRAALPSAELRRWCHAQAARRLPSLWSSLLRMWSTSGAALAVVEEQPLPLVLPSWIVFANRCVRSAMLSSPVAYIVEVPIATARRPCACGRCGSPCGTSAAALA